MAFLHSLALNADLHQPAHIMLLKLYTNMDCLKAFGWPLKELVNAIQEEAVVTILCLNLNHYLHCLWQSYKP